MKQLLLMHALNVSYFLGAGVIRMSAVDRWSNKQKELSSFSTRIKHSGLTLIIIMHKFIVHTVQSYVWSKHRILANNCAIN